ncbi:hypothetical protein GQ54DRAFT_192127 [Martensiomyces pterosporus]|nr:hypothetical protein GQ54DRAFT_192127 [Martensiomyces pterosporus]
MFPSLGLLSQIECPYKGDCMRGSLCFYKHLEKHRQMKQPQPPSASCIKDWDATNEEILLDDNGKNEADQQRAVAKPHSGARKSMAYPQQDPGTGAQTTKDEKEIGRHITPVPQCHDHNLQSTNSVETPPPNNTASAKSGENEAGSAAVDPCHKTAHEEGEKDAGASWRALTLNYDRANAGYNAEAESRAILPQLKAVVGDRIGYPKRQKSVELFYEQYRRIDSQCIVDGRPWAAAMHAVEREQAVYRASAPGTYHADLVSSLRQLKKEAGP